MRISQIAVAALLAAFVFAPAAGRAAESNAAGPEQLRGTIVAVSGNVLTLRLRNGQNENVDIEAAQGSSPHRRVAEGRRGRRVWEP